MIEQLDRLTITDFRSIKGSIWVPLDAPIVLIHGPNGSGKTSLFSALELALTGDIAAMRRDDPMFLTHLVHQGAPHASVILSGPAKVDGDFIPAAISVIEGAVTGRALLDPPSAQFFSERCYLAQSALGRLLEMYQHADPHKDSALTRFVKDLLGLDQLDALVDGLHDAGDIRRTKNLVPEFRAAEDLCKSLRARNDAASLTIRDQATALDAARKAFADTVSTLGAVLVDSSPPLADLDAMASLLEQASEDPQLITLAQQRRELISIRNAWSGLPTNIAAADRSASEAEETAAASEVYAWRAGLGATLDALLDGLRSMFPDLPSSASTDPSTAHATAIARVVAEVNRLQDALKQEYDAATRERGLDEDVRRVGSRIQIIDEQIAAVADDASGLSQALASLTPHIHGENCPVCGRDFSDISKEPLIGHVQQKIARLTEQAGRLSAFALEKSQATGRLSALQREREMQSSKRLKPEELLAVQARLASLTETSATLTVLAKASESGTAAVLRFANAQRRLAELRDRDRIATDLRVGTASLCVTLGQTELGESEGLASALDRLQRHVTAEQTRLETQRATRLQALTTCRALSNSAASLEKARAEAAALATELEDRERILELADCRRLQAKSLCHAARDARTAIVRRVFNDSLNSIWRDLFVRLAPTEPFVPAFKLPETTDGVVAALETLHRSGQRGGTPGAMLSAGNLNTAALTLFIALHLSVSARLPWLVLDDPVQSMDEVHIAQFAALLRTLCKSHGRKYSANPSPPLKPVSKT